MTPFAFLLLCLASWRVAVLITVDTLTRPLREKVEHRWPPVAVPLRDGRGEEVAGTARLRPSLPAEFVNCPYCVGLWSSGAGALLLHAAGMADRWAWVGLGWLAAAGVGVLLSDLSERLSK